MAARYSISCNDGWTINTTVTNRASVVSQWISKINSEYGSSNRFPSGVVVGLDIEWRPNYYYGSNNPAATLQLCVNSYCLVIQLCYLDLIPQSLRQFLTNPRYVFVGVGVDKDVEKLWNDYGLKHCRTRDVRDVAVKKRPHAFSSKQPGLKEIASVCAGLTLEKDGNVRLSDWETEKLSCDQVVYASMDAYASWKIGVRTLRYLGKSASD